MSPKRYAHLAAFVLDHPWAITPGMLPVLAAILAERVFAGTAADPGTVEAALLARKNDLPQPARGGVAVIPIYGVTAPRMNLISESSGGTSHERVAREVRAAGNDASVKTIVLDIDSPGGSVAGAAELAATLREVRTRKAIVAQFNHQGTSAAYWIAAQATKIHASPSATLGSIGVFTIHHDLSEALGKIGVKRTLISAGKYKLEGFDGEPLTEEAHARRTAMVAASYDRFVADVAKGRGITASAVRAGYGEGRCVSAEEGLDLGMVDKIATLEDTIDHLLPAGSALEPLGSRSQDTPQEPARVTGQDPAIDVQWRSRFERESLGWLIGQ